MCCWALICALCGCSPALAPNPVEPLPEGFSQSGSKVVPEQWWTEFNDQQLNELVSHALSNNLNLKSAWMRLSEAQAIAERESSELLPTIDLFGLAQRRDQDSAEFNEDSSRQRYEAGLAASYELDLWQRVRASVRAEELRSRAQAADYQTAALSLSAELATAWFRLLEALARRDVIKQQIEANNNVLTILKAQFGNGLTRRADILRQAVLLEATREELIAVESEIKTLENLIAVLLGQAPQSFNMVKRSTLPADLPPRPSTGIPSDLIKRRPDIQSAFYLLQAADQDLAAAIRDRFPRITLSASIFTVDDDEFKFFDDWLNSVAANALAPIFDGGRRRAEVRRSESLRERRLYEYAQSILDAFREVEDALTQENKQTEKLQSLETQVRLASETYEQLRRQYFNGTGNYIDLIASLTNQQNLQRELLIERRKRLELRISLYRALAGGFVNAEVQKQS